MNLKLRRSRRASVAILALAVASAGGGIAALVGTTNASGIQWHKTSTLSSSSHAAAPAISAIVQSFIEFANSQSADGAVSSVQYVSASDGAAVVTSISGDSTDQTGPVIALEASGQFVANAAKTPEGAPTPTGTVITEIVDQNTGAIWGWGVSNNLPNLSVFGTVQTAQ
jgi:hypothetical protein